MKTLEIDETETQLVIKVAGSKVARVVAKEDAEAARDAMLEALAEAPAEKEPEPEPEPGELPPAAGAEDMPQAIGETMEALGAILRSPEAEKVKSTLESIFPVAKRYRKTSG